MFPCNIAGCDRSFTTGNGRAIHIGRSHNKVQTNPPYPCSICEFGAHSASAINQHMRRRHEDTTIPRLRGAHHWPGRSIGIYMSENMIVSVNLVLTQRAPSTSICDAAMKTPRFRACAERTIGRGGRLASTCRRI
uniref:C2H2-type domain-containing protein n=1 Tax=Globodera rostochiensis TaxID=31243 RepID=A0A914HKJ0_GLORO